MKKLITLFISLIIAGTAFLQQILKFKGVPIGGTLQSCINAMI
jgi:hypothetical protein